MNLKGNLGLEIVAIHPNPDAHFIQRNGPRNATPRIEKS
jgi:hypothetical protein